MFGLDFFQNSSLNLGINERNLFYINKYNSKSSINIANNKLITKSLLLENKIPTPRLILSIGSYKSLQKLDFNKLPPSFVVKPCRGIEGGGIEIFYNRDKNGKFIKASGQKFSYDDLFQHCKKILDGDYSMNNKPDKIIFEERIKLTKEFKDYSYKGTPDIRIIVFNKIPIMSYIRIPTKESDGKANLALGAIGCGIDIARGITTTGVVGKSTVITKFPNTNIPVSGIKIPFWNTILRRSIESSMLSGLGFCAVDFLIDKEFGPMIVELNARPGLSIQIANQDSMKWRLKKAKGIKIGKNIEKGIRIAKDLFGGEIQEEIEDLTGKIVIGLNNKVSFLNMPSSGDFDSVVDTSKIVSTIPTDLFEKLLLSIKDTENLNDTKVLNLGFTVNESNTTVYTKFTSSTKSDKVILGQNALKKFLIDSSL